MEIYSYNTFCTLVNVVNLKHGEKREIRRTIMVGVDGTTDLDKCPAVMNAVTNRRLP